MRTITGWVGDIGRMMELELAFKYPAGRRLDVDRLVRARGGAGRAIRRDTVYFDTPDCALASSGFSLGVRRVGRFRVQTLISLGQTGIGATPRDRYEKEWRLSGDAPDIELLRMTPVAPIFDFGARSVLHPVFAIKLARTVYAMQLDDVVGAQNSARLEIVVDEGAISAGAATEAVHDIRFELKSGPRAALYRFALALNAELPLSIASENNARRGFRLRSGRGQAARKPPSIMLPPRVTMEGSLRRILESGLAQFIGNLSAVDPDGDGEGVHQCRVAIRRLRSALALFKGILQDDAARRFERQLRQFGRVFGEARDWDVFVLETIPRASDEGMDGAWLNLLLKPADAARVDAYRTVSRLIEGQELTEFVLAFAAWTAGAIAVEAQTAAGRIADAPMRDLTPDLLDRLAATVTKRGRHLHRRSSEELHTLRKRFKKLRYAVEFLGCLYDSKDVKHYRLACEELQEVLGAINDAAATDALVARIAESPNGARLAPSIGVLSRWTARHRAVALARLPVIWRGFKAESPFWR
jgi:inorganic triphosphatase YgiF